MLARLIAPVALVALAALPLRAQDTTAHPAPAPDTTEHPGAWLLGAGRLLAHGPGDTPALQLGREWRAPNSRFGLRWDAAYLGNSGRTYPIYGANYVPAGTSTESYRDFGLSLLTTFALTRGRIQPYLVSGFRLERRYDRLEIVDFSNPDNVPGAGTLNVRPGTYRNVTMNLVGEAGIGLQARVGPVWAFVERKSAFPTNHSESPARRHFTFGLRF